MESGEATLPFKRAPGDCMSGPAGEEPDRAREAGLERHGSQATEAQAQFLGLYDDRQAGFNQTGCLA